MSIDATTQEIDLTTCDREPIHILGRIQSFGALISVTSDWIINHASQNVGGILGENSGDFVGRPIGALFTDDAVHHIRSRLQLLSSQDAIDRIFGLKLTQSDELFDVALHISGGSIVIEIEKHVGEQSQDYIGSVRAMIERIKKADTIESLCQIASRQLRALIQFDRVMVYRFAEDGTGEVIAESLNGDVESFMGLRYPASDIPKQARKIYERNLLRIISDVYDEGVVIEPAVDPDGIPLDLTMSAIRSVSPIHLEYLKNMGVNASLSISILKRGKLWGLFACHNNTSKRLSFDRRTAAELFAQLFSFLLDQKNGDYIREEMIQSRILHDKIMVQLADGGNISDNLDMLASSIKSIIPFDGIALWVDGKLQSQGSVPTREQFLPLARFLNTTGVSQIYVADSLSKVHPAAKDYVSTASGILALPVSRSPRDYLVLFRKELTQSVNWAGNPNKPVISGPLGDRLTPRKSFEAWQETVHAHSASWTNTERRAAESLRVTLLEVVLRMADASLKERKKSQETQELLIAELNHRVRNILNLIRGLVSQSSGAKDVTTFTDIVGGRIQALARAHDQITEENWTPASIYSLINTEAKAYLGEESNRVVLSGRDVLITPTAFTTLSLVIHEMMTNSAKYGALTEQNGKVEIILERNEVGALEIVWTERGGPAVTAPTRKGFGTTIIERSIPFELKGTANIDYDLSGVRALFTIPAKFIHSFAEPIIRTPEQVTSSADPQVKGKALVVEDNMIIALDAEDILTELGASEVFVASSVSEAMGFIQENEISFAMLDVNLGAETSELVALKLRENQTPFIFATGYGERINLKENFPTTIIVQKPYNADTVKDAISKIG